MILTVAVLASIAAFLGGFLALSHRDRLHIILGLSAGAVLGAALFDLIPESIELGMKYHSVLTMTSLTGLGFLIYLVLDRIFSFHHSDEERSDGKTPEERGQNTHSGTLGALSFCLHSLLDGIAIGTAFQADTTIGGIIAIAVIAHRFSDGINTVGVIIRNKDSGKPERPVLWLTLVALAPILGAWLTSFISISPATLASLLAIFAGFFLYIGASDLIPEGHHSHAKTLTTVMTLVGAAILYLIVTLAG